LDHLTNAGGILMTYNGDGDRMGKAVRWTTTYYLVDDENLMTNTKQYAGRILRLSYPAFLRVNTKEPRWSAFDSKGRASAVVSINPPLPEAKAFARLVRNRNFPSDLIEREGFFSTGRGIEGHERVTRQIKTMSWFIDGKFRGHHVLNIQLWAVKDCWFDGLIWKDFIESIDFVKDSSDGPPIKA
jgi:hypothetical protein